MTLDNGSTFSGEVLYAKVTIRVKGKYFKINLIVLHKAKSGRPPDGPKRSIVYKIKVICVYEKFFIPSK